MRAIILEEIYFQMKENKDIYFLTGDLGFHSVEHIERDFPKRFINAGIAEQNMIGMAAGLALQGKKVYVYSIIPFVTMRCYEQIRNDVCYHNLDVTLLGAGAGLTYGILSSTHFALEDIAILRPLPHMSIFSPADDREAQEGMKYFSTRSGPLYIRIGGRKEKPLYTNESYRFIFGKGFKMASGTDIAIFSTGPITRELTDTIRFLKERKNMTATVVVIHTIKPIDQDIIMQESIGKKMIFSLEEHFTEGGLGSGIAEVISEHLHNVKLVRLGMKCEFVKEIGTQTYIRKQHKLDSEGIYSQIMYHLERYI